MDKKMINQLLIDGKSTVSEKIWLKTLKLFDKSFVRNNKKAVNRAIVNLTPLLKVKQLKQKRRQTQLKEFPYIVKDESRISLALKFFLTKTKNKKETKMYERLVTELVTVANKSGVNVTKKKSLYEYAFLKKKYFYYRWF
jgi:small subunit ribosomal protein S7